MMRPACRTSHRMLSSVARGKQSAQLADESAAHAQIKRYILTNDPQSALKHYTAWLTHRSVLPPPRTQEIVIQSFFSHRAYEEGLQAYRLFLEAKNEPTVRLQTAALSAAVIRARQASADPVHHRLVAILGRFLVSGKALEDEISVSSAINAMAQLGQFDGIERIAQQYNALLDLKGETSSLGYYRARMKAYALQGNLNKAYDMLVEWRNTCKADDAQSALIIFDLIELVSEHAPRKPVYGELLSLVKEASIPLDRRALEILMVAELKLRHLSTVQSLFDKHVALWEAPVEPDGIENPDYALADRAFVTVFRAHHLSARMARNRRYRTAQMTSHEPLLAEMESPSELSLDPRAIFRAMARREKDRLANRATSKAYARSPFSIDALKAAMSALITQRDWLGTLAAFRAVSRFGLSLTPPLLCHIRDELLGLSRWCHLTELEEKILKGVNRLKLVHLAPAQQVLSASFGRRSLSRPSLSTRQYHVSAVLPVGGMLPKRHYVEDVLELLACSHSEASDAQLQMEYHRVQAFMFDQ
ncbi:uncharacterized protein L969DRAFT_55453 [Mixia osmundae IAM 14324]|uniref:Uncharacterized protein n=1 Tax=Mixia osmundae (strain CBS 9802 / IAM 14324 / JCM 22182 / KY 12970) TaxID=764103 RepID=G7E4F6_MIXOS|nr:uncharacterized protein L969DRAFT_55453 [Mixia osmundae IAM 14324]KEI36267.1 hypothetical protein L969DRAFT_55453 [Mixia osmundae IAM 14324]GAA97716.1 hypothetical protein E5Q_04395 [Mixia osmundae IAM 14324]